MRVDVHFYGSVPMRVTGSDAARDRSIGGPATTTSSPCYGNLCHWAQHADRLGFDTMWLTEHHFQHEGYEVTPEPDPVRRPPGRPDRRLRFGQFFNIVPQWHPLRLAEDFAMADMLTEGRLVFGVGRGTVPREARDARRHGGQR